MAQNSGEIETAQEIVILAGARQNGLLRASRVRGIGAFVAGLPRQILFAAGRLF